MESPTLGKWPSWPHKSRVINRHCPQNFHEYTQKLAWQWKSKHFKMHLLSRIRWFSSDSHVIVYLGVRQFNPGGLHWKGGWNRQTPVTFVCIFGDVGTGFDPMANHHHFSPPFGEDLFVLFNHRTSKSKDLIFWFFGFYAENSFSTEMPFDF